MRPRPPSSGGPLRIGGGRRARRRDAPESQTRDAEPGPADLDGVSGRACRIPREAVRSLSRPGSIGAGIGEDKASADPRIRELHVRRRCASPSQSDQPSCTCATQPLQVMAQEHVNILEVESTRFRSRKTLSFTQTSPRNSFSVTPLHDLAQAAVSELDAVEHVPSGGGSATHPVAAPGITQSRQAATSVHLAVVTITRYIDTEKQCGRRTVRGCASRPRRHLNGTHSV